jgi:hypothetical protein
MPSNAFALWLAELARVFNEVIEHEDRNRSLPDLTKQQNAGHESRGPHQAAAKH